LGLGSEGSFLLLDFCDFDFILVIVALDFLVKKKEKKKKEGFQ